MQPLEEQGSVTVLRILERLNGGMMMPMHPLAPITKPEDIAAVVAEIEAAMGVPLSDEQFAKDVEVWPTQTVSDVLQLWKVRAGEARPKPDQADA
jgi:mono/diheme cytochrome c family protein